LDLPANLRKFREKEEPEEEEREKRHHSRGLPGGERKHFLSHKILTSNTSKSGTGGKGGFYEVTLVL